MSINVTFQADDAASLTSEMATLIKGDKGDKGDQGEQGLQGDKGDTYTITESDYDAIAQKVLSYLDSAEGVTI